jgi:uncharacterized protein
LELDSYTLILLRRPPDAPQLPDDEIDQLQEAHLAHLGAMASAGKLVGAGPSRDQADESLRGPCFYACALDEARTLAEQDPSVRAGRLAIDAMTWLTPSGSVSFHRNA